MDRVITIHNSVSQLLWACKTHPVNIPCGKKPEYSEKTNYFRQSVDLYTFFMLTRYFKSNKRFKKHLKGNSKKKFLSHLKETLKIIYRSLLQNFCIYFTFGDIVTWIIEQSAILD